MPEPSFFGQASAAVANLVRGNYRSRPSPQVGFLASTPPLAEGDMPRSAGKDMNLAQLGQRLFFGRYALLTLRLLPRIRSKLG